MVSFIQNNPQLKNVPLVRRFVFNYLRNWIQLNPKAELVATIIQNIKMKLSVNDWVQQNIFLNGYYEKNETDYWLRRTQNSTTVIDIGANVGYYSLLASKNIKPQTGVVYAFEPISKTFKRLTENIHLNKINNIQYFNQAISDENSFIQIHVGNDENWGMSSINEHEHLSGVVEKVKSETLDNFCKEHNIANIDLVKIDVEGAEFKVLKGMTAVIEKFKPEVLIEILDQHLNKQNVSSTDIFNFFWERGYQAFTIIKNGELNPISEAKSYSGLICFKYSKSL
jgi:FkbM family methyltransferase